MLSSNFALARRLEMVEAAVARRTADAFLRAGSQEAAVAESLAGGTALFAGIGSPLTHAVGIGMSGPVLLQEMDRLQEFFHSRGSPCVIDLCAMADSGVIGAIIDRRYRVVELNNVMMRRLVVGEEFLAPPEGICFRRMQQGEEGLWARTVLQGFMGDEHVVEETIGMMAPTAHIGSCYLAIRDGSAVAGCAMAIHEGVADLFADSTLVSARGLGIQQALIRRRLADALSQGCDVAMASVLPGSSSHRNYERCGFHLAYVRVNVALDA